MRRILIESARRKRADRHGGGRRRVDWKDVIDPTGLSPDDLLDLDQALTEFERVDPTKAALVRLRFFAGLEEAQAAEALGISRPVPPHGQSPLGIRPRLVGRDRKNGVSE